MTAEADEHKGEKELLGKIYQKLTPPLPDAAERKFHGWHHPRKYYVRTNQWCTQIQSLIADLRKMGTLGQGDIRCLGMPADDFLDVHVLREVCESTRVGLYYLGFDSTAKMSAESYEVNISSSEMVAQTFVNKRTIVCRDRIEMLGKSDSPAFAQLQKHGPFDIINLDLCDSVTSSGVGKSSYFEAIRGMCEYQVKHRPHPWLLFITTRAAREFLENASKERLFGCVAKNAAGSPTFSSELQASMNVTAAELADEIKNVKQLDHATLVKLFGLSVGKWLLQLMMSDSPKVHVRLLESFSYRVDKKDPDMLALAFRLEPKIEQRKDASGLSSGPKAGAPAVSEEDLARELIPMMTSIVDVDKALENDDVFGRMREGSGALMEIARYDKQDYFKWVDAQPRRRTI